MGKNKKDKPSVINNIKNLNLEIDYDKLAKAIVEAQNKANEEVESSKNEKIGFWKAVKHIILNDAETNGTLMSNSLALFLNMFFNIIAIVGCLIALAVLPVSIKFLIGRSWNGVQYVVQNILFIILTLSIIVCILLFPLIFRGVANEIEKEKDRNYIVAVFASIATFVAMFATIITLLKQLGL